MKALETERLVVRSFLITDWEALPEMIVQYEASEYAVYDHQWPTSAEKIKEITEWFAGGESFLAVCLKDSGRFIGFVSLNQEPIEQSREFSIGYCFRFDYHGKGYASEACRAVIAYAFDQLHAQCVVTGTAAANQPSCRLLERLGFRRTAESIASFRNSQDGKPIEFLGYTYAISSDEWVAARKRE